MAMLNNQRVYTIYIPIMSPLIISQVARGKPSLPELQLVPRTSGGCHVICNQLQLLLPGKTQAQRLFAHRKWVFNGFHVFPINLNIVEQHTIVSKLGYDHKFKTVVYPLNLSKPNSVICKGDTFHLFPARGETKSLLKAAGKLCQLLSATQSSRVEAASKPQSEDKTTRNRDDFSLK